MDQSPVSKKRQLIATLAVLIVIVVIVSAVAVANNKKMANADVATTSPSATDTTGSTSSGGAPDTQTGGTGSSTASANFKDGDYTATGSYESPGGQEDITVKVTLQNGAITDTSAKSGANDPEASEYQDQFISGYKSLVVGKNIGDVHLSRVSGSSLTSQGFNDAIQQIESQARA